jgi:hypothetical protein
MATRDFEMPRPLWRHPDPKSTGLERFRVHANTKHGLNLQVCCYSIPFAEIRPLRTLLDIQRDPAMVRRQTV